MKLIYILNANDMKFKMVSLPLLRSYFFFFFVSPEQASLSDKIGEQNVGNQLLRKMGEHNE